MSLGQRLGQYLRHPTTGITPDGAPLDAGSAHILHANLSELSAQNARLIGQHVGPGVVGYDTTTFAQWTNVYDVFEQSNSDAFARMPWMQPTQCVAFGPFNALAMSLDGRGFTHRDLKVLVDVTKGNVATTTLTIMAAVTSVYDTPLRTERVASDFQSFPHTSPGDFTSVLDLQLRPVRPSASWRCRDGGDSTAAVAPLWLWVGWFSNDINNADFVHSVSAFEVRS